MNQSTINGRGKKYESSPEDTDMRVPLIGSYQPTRMRYSPGGKSPKSCCVVMISPIAHEVVGRVQSAGIPSVRATMALLLLKEIMYGICPNMKLDHLSELYRVVTVHKNTAADKERNAKKKSNKKPALAKERESDMYSDFL